MKKKEQLDKLKEIVQQQKELERQAIRLSAPDVKGAEIINLISLWCDQYCQMKKSDSIPIKTRRMKLYAVLAFVCPIALVGGRLSKGLRMMLSTIIFTGHKATVISSDIAYVVFCYEHYANVREELDELVSFIEKKIVRHVS